MKTLYPAFLLIAALMMGCTIKTEPIKVEPIHITVDINLRISQELNDFFGDLDAESDLLDYDEGLEP